MLLRPAPVSLCVVFLLLACPPAPGTEYDAGTPITDVSITNPVANEVWLIGTPHTLSCTTSSDTDRQCDGGDWYDVSDTVTHYWTGSGTFEDNDNIGTSVSYICANSVGNNTVTVYANDNYAPASNTAIVDESPTSDSETVSVVGLEVHEVGFGNDHALKRTPTGAGSYDGWADSTTTIADPVYDADDTADEKAAKNHACFTKGAGGATLASVRCRATTALTETSAFHLRALGTDSWGWAVFSISAGNRESGTGSLSLDSDTLATTVKRYGGSYSCAWKYRCFSGADVEASLNATSHSVYLTYGTPSGSSRTVKRISFLCGEADGQDEITPCADEIYGALAGSPPDFVLGGGNPSNRWWMMDPSGPSGECISLARLMQDMCKLLGLGSGEIGYIYGTTDNNCYSTSSSAYEPRTCPVHGNEEIAYYAGGWNNWEAVFKINGWYYAVKEAKSQTPVDIIKTILGANNPGPTHTGNHQAWVGAGGGTTCCENPGPHPLRYRTRA